MLIDCDTCAVRGEACAGCVVSVLLPAEPVEWDETERRALRALADVGLIPELRLTLGREGGAGDPPPILPTPAVSAPVRPPARGALPWPPARRRAAG